MKPNTLVAVCINCGALKESIADPCDECGLNPQQDDQTTAKSLYLSVARFEAEDEDGKHDDELLELSNRIRSGKSIEYPAAELVRLLKLKEEMDSVNGWHLVAYLLRVFFPAIVLVAALYLFGYLIQWLAGK